MKNILIVDDEPVILNLFRFLFEEKDLNVDVRGAGSGNDAIQEIQKRKPDLIVLDLKMKHGDGFFVLEHLKEKGLHTPVIVFTNYDNAAYVTQCKSMPSVKEYFVKFQVKSDRVMRALTSTLELA